MDVPRALKIYMNESIENGDFFSRSEFMRTAIRDFIIEIIRIGPENIKDIQKLKEYETKDFLFVYNNRTKEFDEHDKITRKRRKYDPMRQKKYKRGRRNVRNIKYLKYEHKSEFRY